MSYSSGRGRGGRGRGGGRGEYYKNKYGSGGRSVSTGRGSSDGQEKSSSPTGGGSYHELQSLLQRLDGKSYPAYHDLDTPMDRGWVNSVGKYTLFVAKAQSDPFAPPTRCRIVVDASKAAIPKELYSNKVRSMALADFLLRRLHETCQKLGADDSLHGNGWSGPKGGDLQVLEPCQHVLEQSAVRIDEQGNVIAQFTVNLPARGRTILGRTAETIFGRTIPTIVERSLQYNSLTAIQLKQHVDMVEDQVWLQSQLEARNLVAFVRKGAILPRFSGADDRPMDKKSAVPFVFPKRLEVSFELPNAGKEVTGLGIPKGVTLICGGGFHGKSTLLATLEKGIYPKIPDDGREFCMTSKDACKIRAEDGRHVQAVDISNFINNLPGGKDTTCFCSMDASGSTSQAANIVEAIEYGSNALLIDEDTCATNFMVRDRMMTQLVAKEKEPITPLIEMIRSLYDHRGVSSVLVIGGTGDYFKVADNILVLDSYVCYDATERAKKIVAKNKSQYFETPTEAQFRSTTRSRIINGGAFVPNGNVKTVSKDLISYGAIDVDLRCLEQLVSKSQTTTIGYILQRIPSLAKGGKPFLDVIREINNAIDATGLDGVAPEHCMGGLSRPRSFEIAGTINRFRSHNSIYQDN
ncbi:ABC transporter ATPase [Nitzschia inconspicua]|uniref:ABC transporter ATPase n=1 Tax=Nitzschia inconspicua TaxID=303405 RepID=A0A9K3KNZ0_9STRA|nr:ABC transporter ATPase [Nitzschia inconspicua]